MERMRFVKILDISVKYFDTKYACKYLTSIC